MQPDKKDLAVLRELDANARAGLAEIGRKVRLSKSAVAQRISRLEADGLILGYSALIDISRLGYLSFRTYIKFAGTDPKTEEAITRALIADERVWWAGKIQGPWDLGFLVWVRDHYEFRNFWLDFMGKYKRHIGRFIISPYIKLRHYHLDFLTQSESRPHRPLEVIGEGPRVPIDRTDQKLLAVVSASARLSHIEIAKRAGLSPTVVAYRLRQLVRKGVIQNFRVIINTPALGYSLYKINLSLNDITKAEEMRSFVETFPSLCYIDESVGTDFEVDFYLRNQAELEEVLRKIKTRFHSVINEYDYLVYTQVLKYVYFPRV